MDTLALELSRLRQSLLDYRSGQPATTRILYCVANDEKHFYGLADREGEIIFRTTREAFDRLSTTFTLSLLRLSPDGTQLWGLRVTDIEKTDEEHGLLLPDLLVREPEQRME